jgi:hypothetical protein
VTDIIDGKIVIDESKAPDFSAGDVLEAEVTARETLPFKPRSAQASSWAYNCPKRGHTFDPEMPPMVAQLADRVFGVRICMECGAPIYTQIAKVNPSSLVDAGGSPLLSDS